MDNPGGGPESRHPARVRPRSERLALSHPEVLIALRRARDLTDRDFAQPLTLDSMAQAAHLSKFHFARAFAKAYGETPRTYLTRRRIERAKDLLRAANLTITEICFLVGFERSAPSARASTTSWACRPPNTGAP